LDGAKAGESARDGAPLARSGEGNHGSVQIPMFPFPCSTNPDPKRNHVKRKKRTNLETAESPEMVPVSSPAVTFRERLAPEAARSGAVGASLAVGRGE